MMAKTKHSQNQDLQDEKMNRITEDKSSKSAKSENPASDKWDIPSDWEVKRFTEFCDLKHGFQFREEHFVESGIPIIKIGSLIDGSGIREDNLTFIKTEMAHQFDNFKLREGDILMALTGGTLGKVCVFPKRETTYLQNYRVGNFIPFTNASREYILHLLQSYIIQDRIMNLVNEAAQPNFGKQDFDKIKVSLPPLPEQTAIAQLLSTWDNAITKTKALIAQKEQRKKWLMQNLLTGKMRLKGFDGEWEDIELGELLNYEQPTKHLVKDTLYNNLYATPVLTAGKTFILGYTNEENGICTDLPVVIFDDFTTASKYVDFPFKAKSSAMKLLRPKSTANLKYVFEAMQQMQYAVGGHERHWISKFVYLTVPCPSLEEQTAIAKVLQAADKEIQLLKTKCGKLKEQKKGLMQVLLTGKKRLKIETT
jgi:type I restriction enzyme S subunit